MTEADWLAATELKPTLAVLSGKATERKCRLLEIACLRTLFWHLLTDTRSRTALEVADRHADGAATPDEVERAYGEASAAFEEMRRRYFPVHGGAPRSFSGGPVSAAQHVSHLLIDWTGGRFHPYRSVANAHWSLTAAYPLPEYPPADETDDEEDDEAYDEAREAGFAIMHAAEPLVCRMVREVFGNPFRPVALDPSWLTWSDSTVRKLAEAAYNERQLPEGTLDPSRLALLADALEDAGCTEAHLLHHLRSPGPHCRGCWAADLVLGKE
jgi:hypothetical protein